MNWIQIAWSYNANRTTWKSSIECYDHISIDCKIVIPFYLNILFWLNKSFLRNSGINFLTNLWIMKLKFKKKEKSVLTVKPIFRPTKHLHWLSKNIFSFFMWNISLVVLCENFQFKNHWKILNKLRGFAESIARLWQFTWACYWC